MWDEITADEWAGTLQLDLEEPHFNDFEPDHQLFPSSTSVEEPFPLNLDCNIVKPEASTESLTNFVPYNPGHAAKPQLQAICPCCKKTLETKHFNVHAHVSQCFTENKKSFDGKQCPSATQTKIESIRRSASRLSLSRRIALLESLNRLAQNSKASRPTWQAFGEEAAGHSEDDVLAISLLYSQALKSTAGMKVDIHLKGSRISQEVVTPNTHHMDHPRLPSGLFSLGVSIGKRKRGVLSFSPPEKTRKLNCDEYDNAATHI